MTQNLPPPIPSLIPETAPFSEEQRIWLNGFFAGLVSLDDFGVTPLSGEQAAALISGATASKADDDDDGGALWHDQTLPMAERMNRIAASAATTARIIRAPSFPARRSG